MMLGLRRLVSAALCAFVVMLCLLLDAAPPAAARPAQVTRTLDYLHAVQAADGHFQDVAYTPWAVIAIAACGEDPDGAAWAPAGNSPIDYMQSLDLDAHASGGATSNPPAFYAKMILAYVAAGRRASLAGAGSKRIDLVKRLLAYQRSDGRVCPVASSDHIGAVNATIWAVIALDAAGTEVAARARAVAWLKGQQLADGGFGNMAKDGPGTPVSDVDDTAAALQALIGGGTPRADSVVVGARAYLVKAQRADGGFSSAQTGGYTYSESTAWALQAILALDESPTASAWTKNGRTPRDALVGLQASNGSMQHRAGVVSTVMLSTTQSLVALAGKEFSSFPGGGASWQTPFSWSPRVTTLSPANGETLRSTTMLVTAKYSDGDGGTGVLPSAVRLTLDSRDMTRYARVSGSSLSAKLTGVTAGRHAIRLTVRDRAGNARGVTHTVTVRASLLLGGTSGSGGQAGSSSVDSGSAGTGVAGPEITGVENGLTASPEAGANAAGEPTVASSAAGVGDATGRSQSAPSHATSESGAAGVDGPGTGDSSQADASARGAGRRGALFFVGIAIVPIALGFGFAAAYRRRLSAAAAATWQHADGPPVASRTEHWGGGG